MSRRFALAAVGLWAAALALSVAIAGQAATVIADVNVATAFHSFAVDNQWLAWVARLFAAMGSAWVLAPLMLAVVVVLWRRGLRWWAVWLACSGIGGLLISQVGKRLVDRQRPTWDNPLHELSSPSFPSGHSMAGIYGYVAFGIIALALLRQRWIGVALIVFGVLMGPSRVAFGVHWPSDVLAGWLFAGAWLCTVTAVLWWRLGAPPTQP